jgi:hypothetical protein
LDWIKRVQFHLLGNVAVEEGFCVVTCFTLIPLKFVSFCLKLLTCVDCYLCFLFGAVCVAGILLVVEEAEEM